MASPVFLRPWSPQIAEELFAAVSDPSLYDLNPLPPPLNVEEFIRRHDPSGRKNTATYSAHLVQHPGTPIGLAVVEFDNHIECNIGFLLSRNYWGQGLGEEIVKMLLVKLAKHSIPMTVMAKVDERNTRSSRLLEKCGFKHIKNVKAILKFKASVDKIYSLNISGNQAQ